MPVARVIPRTQDFMSLKGIVTMFQDPEAVFAGWTHYIAFDLWTGKWIATDAASRGIPRALVAPCLFFTLMLGPTGLLMYFALRTFYPSKPHSD